MKLFDMKDEWDAKRIALLDWILANVSKLGKVEWVGSL
jgi:hypothetical protein